MTKVYDTILEEILKRKRINIPTVVLTGSRFREEGLSSPYSIFIMDRTLLEQEKFKYTGSCINFYTHKTELLYLKMFTTNIPKKVSTEWKDYYLIRSTTIIKIHDLNDKVFYMYIKVGIKGYCKCCDGHNDLKYRIIYSSSFDDLVTFVYKREKMPDFLNSEAFVSEEDKGKEQLTILKAHDELFIKKVKYDENSIKIIAPSTLSGWMPFDETMNIIINYKTRTISATTSKYTYSTKYNVSDEWYANEIITKGSNTISVKIYIDNGSIDIIVSNDIKTIKRFRLKEIISQI
jgi:hypothetical protein